MLTGLFALAACTKQDTQPAAYEVPPFKADAKRAESAFEVALTLKQSAQGDAPGQLTARITAKPGFHVNTEYPTNFQPARNDRGVAFDKPRYPLNEGVERAPCSSNPADVCELRATIPFRQPETGATRAEGVLAFSVCDPNQCLIEKIPVSAEVSAKPLAP